MSEAFDERMKLIRFRRKRERFRLREEIKIVPKWVIWTCVVLWLAGHRHRYADKSLWRQWRNFPARFGWSSGIRVSRVGGNHHSRGHNYHHLVDGSRLRIPRCAAPRNEWRALAAFVHAALLAILRHRFHSVLPGTRAAAIPLPALLHHGRRSLQFLPQLQMQFASQLPQLQTRSRRNR